MVGIYKITNSKSEIINLNTSLTTISNSLRKFYKTSKCNFIYE